MKVLIKKSKDAITLEDALNLSFDLKNEHKYDAGFDLRACIIDDVFIPSYSRKLIPTGLHFQFEESNWEAQIRPRSGLAWKHGITVLNTPGTIDYQYRDEVKVILVNMGSELFNIKPGDRIAQVCFREIPTIDFDYTKTLEETGRGGFGSTGV